MQDRFGVPRSGHLRIRAVDRATGRTLRVVDGPNLIVNGGVNAMPEAFRAVITHVAVGTDSTSPLPTDVLPLEDQVLVAVDSSSLPAANQVRWTFVVPSDQANGLVIHEFGLVTAGGVLAARKTYNTGFPKTAEIELHGEWTVTFAYEEE